MTENMKKFLEAISGNAELTEKARNAKSNEALAELAGTLGLTLTAEDFQAPEGEVSDAELDGVAGGMTIGACGCYRGGGGSDIRPGPFPGGCDCYQGGGGASRPGVCRCIPGGGGSAPACDCYQGGGGGDTPVRPDLGRI